MNYIFKIAKLPEDSGLLIDGATERVKHQIKKKEGGFLGAMMACMFASLIPTKFSSLTESVASSLINAVSGNGVMRVGKEKEGGFLPLLILPLMMKLLEKGITRAGKRYNNMDQMNEKF